MVALVYRVYYIPLRRRCSCVRNFSRAQRRWDAERRAMHGVCKHFNSICAIKPDMASSSLLMTTLMQAKLYEFKGDDLRNALSHTYVRASRDATQGRAVKYCKQRESLSWTDVRYSNSQNTNGYDRLQTIDFCLVIRTLPDQVVSTIVTLTRLDLLQIAQKTKPPPHVPKVKNVDVHRQALFSLPADESRSISDFLLYHDRNTSVV